MRTVAWVVWLAVYLVLTGCGPSAEEQRQVAAAQRQVAAAEAKARELGFGNAADMKYFNLRGYESMAEYRDAVARTSDLCFGSSDNYKKYCKGKRVVWIGLVGDNDDMTRVGIMRTADGSPKTQNVDMRLRSSGKPTTGTYIEVDGIAADENVFRPDLIDAVVVRQFGSRDKATTRLAELLDEAKKAPSASKMAFEQKYACKARGRVGEDAASIRGAIANCVYRWKEEHMLKYGLPATIKELTFSADGSSCKLTTKKVTEDNFSWADFEKFDIEFGRYNDTGRRYYAIHGCGGVYVQVIGEANVLVAKTGDFEAVLNLNASDRNARINLATAMEEAKKSATAPAPSSTASERPAATPSTGGEVQTVAAPSTQAATAPAPSSAGVVDSSTPKRVATAEQSQKLPLVAGGGDVPSAPPAPLAVAPATSKPVVKDCQDTVSCVDAMLVAAHAENLAVAMDLAHKMDGFTKPARGDRKQARQLNQKALDAIKQRNMGEAIALLNQAQGLDPSDEEILGNLIYAHIENGGYAKASTAAMDGLNLNPRRANLWLLSGVALQKQGKTKDGLAALWLAWQFSTDKEKMRTFLENKITEESDAATRAFYMNGKEWVLENKKPAG